MKWVSVAFRAFRHSRLRDCRKVPLLTKEGAGGVAQRRTSTSPFTLSLKLIIQERLVATVELLATGDVEHVSGDVARRGRREKEDRKSVV